MLEGEVSHDRITRFLSVYDSRTLWQQVKPMVRKWNSPMGAHIYDTIEEKPHRFSWHLITARTEPKGINILNRLPRLGIRNHPRNGFKAGRMRRSAAPTVGPAGVD